MHIIDNFWTYCGHINWIGYTDLMKSPRCVIPVRAGTGESPLWSAADRCLYWVDIDAPALHRFDASTGTDDSWTMPEAISCIALASSGGLVAAMRSGIYWLDEADLVARAASVRRRLVEAAQYDTSRLRFNDGKVDAAGRLWVGTISDAREPEAGL